jgi:uncharacterized protein involved in response to NO
MLSVLFSSGFRVFFPLGAIGAVLLLPFWILLITGTIDYLPSYFSAPAWHQHEMIFGVFTPIIIGFLYTAVPNWTGKPSPSGWPLGLLGLLWIFGRMTVFYSGSLPVEIPIFLDVSLLPIAIMGIAPAIFKSGSKRNFFLPVMLSIFAIFNLCSHLAALDIINFDENNFFIAALLFVVMLMNVIGGRVAPNFLKNKYKDVKQFNHKAILPVSMVTIVVTMFSIIFSAPEVIIGTSSLIAGLTILIRVTGWKGWVAVKDPLMVILHIGVLWIAVGFLLMAYANFVDKTFMVLSYHALSIGAAGSLTLGVMTRAVIGHSGRPMDNETFITFYLILINVAAISRILAPLIFTEYYVSLLFVSGLCWVLAYLMFLVRFLPVVLKPRADG